VRKSSSINEEKDLTQKKTTEQENLDVLMSSADG
jgi:hypothetical protein